MSFKIQQICVFRESLHEHGQSGSVLAAWYVASNPPYTYVVWRLMWLIGKVIGPSLKVLVFEDEEGGAAPGCLQ